MSVLTDPDAIIVSDTSFKSSSPEDIVQSNVSFVNALFGELFRLDEIEVDALRSYYVDYLYAQVMNGGFSQFVYNSAWNAKVLELIEQGLRAMDANVELRALEKATRFIEQRGKNWLESFLSSDLFGDNPLRDALDEANPSEFAEGLSDINAAWLRRHPKLVVASADEIIAEVRRRAAALPDRAERIAEARAAEPRDLKLIRALCERAGHELDRRTAADRRSFRGESVWAFFFVTDRGPHFMIDLGESALMFPFSSDSKVDESQLVAQIDCAPPTEVH